jgi:HK97 gp10 family phage protein
MGIKFTHSLTGDKALIEKLKSMAGHVREASTEAVEEAAQIVEDRIKSMAPEAAEDYKWVPPGYLRNNINTSPPIQGKTTVEVYVGPDPHKNYPPRMSRTLTKTGKLRKRVLKVAKATRGPWVPLVARWLEYGTSKMAAKPFLRPGFTASERSAFSKIIEVLRGWLVTVIKK